MIRVVMLGRLGNNLFQYAFGRVLAKRYQVPLVMDASWFNSAGWKQVSCIKRLPIRANITRRCSWGARALLKIAGKHYWEYRGLPVLRESAIDQSYDSRFLESPPDCVVMGYFQSPLYFNDCEAEIREELNLKHACHDVPVLPSLKADNAVAVHIRRTDFLIHSAFDVCGTGYYRLAMARIRETCPDALFHFFSDDPAWCRSQYQFADTVVMDCSEDPLHDLYRMSLAQHHIIANSTYSWWAAWLGKKENQRVICPPKWYNGGIQAPIDEKLCPGWETIEVPTNEGGSA